MVEPLVFNAIIPSESGEVWKAWTTESGVRTFFAPECKIDLRSGGAYEMYFDLDAPAGSRGGEGCVILAVDPQKMLSLTWNAPPELPDIRFQRTHVTIRFESVSSHSAKITLTHDGWGTSPNWEAARTYFERAWGEIVIPRLINRFTVGPIHWGNQ
ncbi:MAG: hypothetical protein FD147_1170 [Chloroflexi bacterium]|nr:MAG: hypothetical protein FD147_1170 [Chloroflexota bacterium]